MRPDPDAQPRQQFRLFPDDPDPFGWREEGRSLMRGIAGGAVVGMPLLYTMEVWFHGMVLSEWHLLTLLGATLVMVFLFCLISGFREEASLIEAVFDAVSAVGLALLLSAAVLVLIGAVSPGLAPREALGKVLIEAATVSLGVAYANSQFLHKSRTGDEHDEADVFARVSQDPERMQLLADLKDAAAAVAGAVLFSLNIAPTEEVVLIAARLSPPSLLAILAASVALCYVIMFASEFETHEVYTDSVFQSAWAETAMTCAVGLAVSFTLLALMGEREAMSSASTAVGCVVVLGLPACVGAAAGRLIA